MKILYISGNHPRHFHYINTIKEKHSVAGYIMECREHMIPEPPTDIAETDKKNFIRHFKERNEAELRYFGEQTVPECPTFEAAVDTLNSRESADFASSIRPDLALIFGAHLIKEPLLSALPSDTINLHMGLSPRYRGAATLFWPFYCLEPNYAGSTFHYIVSEPDAGNIIHQVVPELHSQDGIHDVACKTVLASAHDAVRLIDILKTGKTWKKHKQLATGKNFLGNDFKPEHLRVIYNIYDNDMVAQYLDGRLKSKEPKLFKQF